MSLSSESTYWHLTRKGWVAGTTSYDFGYVSRPDPADRLMTCYYFEKLTHVRSKPHVGVEVIWQSDDSERVEQLLKRFGSCPQELDLPPFRTEESTA
jgi:hypothetical protein